MGFYKENSIENNIITNDGFYKINPEISTNEFYNKHAGKDINILKSHNLILKI